MKSTNYWEDFMNSGKIDDYLSFKMQSSDKREEDQLPKEVSNAGFYERYGNGNQQPSDWGI